MQPAGPEQDDYFDFLFKIILIGDTNVGKTCVVQSFKTGLFSERQQNTIGVDFTVRTLNIEGKKVKVSLIFILHSFVMQDCAMRKGILYIFKPLSATSVAEHLPFDFLYKSMGVLFICFLMKGNL